MKFTADQAKHANYACAALTLVILISRAVISRARRRPIDLSFFLVLLSVAVVIVRITVVYYYLLYGTASDALGHANYFDTHDYETVKTGSILTLVARVLITSTCWLQICLLLLFYSQIMEGIRWVAWVRKFTWIVTGATFTAVVLATLLECRPFHLYWQVSPDPGSCIKGYIQLLVQCLGNIGLDLLLLVISYPILFCKGRSWGQYFRVGLLFVLGTFCIIVTTLRVVSVYDNASAQPTRSLWASVQMLVSAFVANAPTIYGDFHVRKRKKEEPRMRRESRPEIWTRIGSASDAGQPDLQMPNRTVTNGSEGSGGLRKDWFDHFENADVEAGRVPWRDTGLK